MLVAFWRWWTNAWQEPSRARLVYLLLAAGFIGISAGGVVAGEWAVAAVAAFAAIVTAVIAVLAPRFARWFSPTRKRELE